MKLTKLALAVASTFIASQTFAAGVTPSEIGIARTGTNGVTKLTEFWITGASAPTFNVFDGFARGCEINTISLFTNSSTVTTPGNMGDYTAFACKRTGSQTGEITVMYHTVAGGSFNAYTPHIASGTGPSNLGLTYPVQLQRLKALDNAACATVTTLTHSIPSLPANVSYYKSCSRGIAASGAAVQTEFKRNTTSPYDITATNTFASLNDAAPSLPHGGFSDVEAALWGVDVDQLNIGTESDTGLLQGFGIVVTNQLYRALQVAQGINAEYTTVAEAARLDPSFLPANAPTMTRAQYAAIAQDFGGYNGNWAPILGTTLAEGKKMQLVRRVATSGTQASSNAFFLNSPCGSGTSGTSPATATDGNFVVSLESGTSGVKNKLTELNSSTVTGEGYAIGVMSLENKTLNEAYHFVKIDGVHPDLEIATATTSAPALARRSMINGSYPFAMELKTFIPTTATAAQSAFVTALSASLSNPYQCTDLGRGMALTSGSSATCETVANATFVYRAKGTKNGNNCSPFQLQY